MSAVDALKKETERLRLAKEKAKQALIQEWESSVDENGTFSHVFGDPEKTGCTRILLLIRDLYPIHRSFNASDSIELC